MISFRQVDIKNRPHYFFNDMTNIKRFDPSLLSIDKTSFKSTDGINYRIEYITMKILDNESSQHLIFNNVDVYIEFSSTEKSNQNK